MLRRKLAQRQPARAHAVGLGAAQRRLRRDAPVDEPADDVDGRRVELEQRLGGVRREPHDLTRPGLLRRRLHQRDVRPCLPVAVGREDVRVLRRLRHPAEVQVERPLRLPVVAIAAHDLVCERLALSRVHRAAEGALQSHAARHESERCAHHGEHVVAGAGGPSGLVSARGRAAPRVAPRCSSMLSRPLETPPRDRQTDRQTDRETHRVRARARVPARARGDPVRVTPSCFWALTDL
eukprot:scaffold19818_cov63-Phaeocystis_antarctica.AAC.3